MFAPLFFMNKWCMILDRQEGLPLFIALFAVWLILNEHITPEICLFGAGLAAAVYLFSCAFLNYSLRKDMRNCKRAFWFVCFLFVLFWEIIKANFAVIIRVLNARFTPSPVLVRFTSPLTSRYGQALYANCITLTPGTITVSLENGVYTVHCLDESFSEGLDSAPIIRLIQKLEAN